MNTSQSIRAWLEANGTHPSRHVADALGLSRKTTGQLLATMVNEGTVTADDEYPRRYTFVRHAVPATERIRRATIARLGVERVDPALRRERARAADKAYYYRNRERLLANKRGREQSKREATASERARKSAERAEARQVEIAKRRLDAELAKQGRFIAALAARAERSSTLATAPKVERVETYEEFIARGGHVERVRAHWEAA